MTLEHVQTVKDQSIDAIALASWWSEGAPALEKTCLVVYAEEVSAGRDGITVEGPDLSATDLAALASRFGAEMAFVSASLVQSGDIDDLLSDLSADGDPDPETVKRLKVLRRAAPVMTSVDVLLVTPSGGRLNLSVNSSDDDLILNTRFDHREDDEDDDESSSRFTGRTRYADTDITAALDSRRPDILAQEPNLCVIGVHEVQELLARHLGDTLAGISSYDIPRWLASSLIQEVATTHARELTEMSDTLIPELFALIPAETVRHQTLSELAPHAREILRRHHACATADSGKSLARRAKTVAKDPRNAASMPTLL
jgi:hypothetical protein